MNDEVKKEMKKELKKTKDEKNGIKACGGAEDSVRRELN